MDLWKYNVRVKHLISIALSFGLALTGLSQPSSSVGGPATACINQNIYLTNGSSGASRYEWDLCPHDIDNLVSDQNIVSASGLSGGYGYKLVEDNGTWYGFVSSQSNHSIYRLDFGSSPLNIPTVVSLGNPSGALSFPMNLDVYKSGGNWYGFVGLYDPNSGLVRLDFGSSLTNAPTATNLGMFGQLGRYWDVKVISENGNLVLVMPLRNGTSSVVRVNYGNSFNNIISNSTDVYTTGPLASLGIATGIDVVPSGSDWVALVAANSNNSIVQLRFPGSILATPSQENNFSGSLSQPFGVRIIREGSRYVAAVTSENVLMKLIDFNDLNPSNAPVEFAYPSLSTLLSVGTCRYQGKSVIQGASFGSQVRGMLFQTTCSAPYDFTQSSVPANLKYSAAGQADIELRAFDAQDLSSAASQKITITSGTAPDIDFTSQNVCVNNNVNFTSANASGNISTYAWDFGDTGSSSSANPTHIYSSASTFNIGLTVTASNGCQNVTQKSLQIFNVPQANFSLPAASPFCTNQNYVFTNTSTTDNGSGPTWQWSVNGSNVSTLQDLTYLFATSTPQSVKLIASLPGCSTQLTQNINTLIDGPLVSFTSASTGCVGSIISFTNTTTGSTTSTTWTFGDASSSNSTNATHVYSSSGQFQAILSSTNAAGCQNSFSKNISIYSQPVPDFDVEPTPLNCAGSPAQFDNNTQALADSNITSWAWSFGDAANGSSTQKNPAYTYATANNYNVTLQATTNFGCTKSTQKSIAILAAPVAGFTNSAACVNQSTLFTDASTGSISSYQWIIQSNTLSGNAPSYVFPTSGNFPVTLKVKGSNGCINQITRNVNVPVKPAIDFSVTAPCTGHPSTFQELNPGGADPAVAWSWNFSEGNSTGSPVNFQFSTVGGYTVTMSSTRQSGCIYATSKNISISAGPTASFTPSVLAGAAPLDVTFNNTSTAETYLWQFDDASQTTSTETSPTFTYSQLGDYKVLLTASNSLGCSDTLSTEINVVVPNVDAMMKNLLLTNDPASNSSKATVTILNSGNMPLLNPEVLVDLGGGVVIKEKISGLVKPGKTIIQTLGLQIVPKSLQYICAEVSAVSDVDVYNNRQCVTLTGDDVVMLPYPNPVSNGQIHFDWIGSAQENVRVTIYRADGEVAFEQSFENVQPGLGQVAINTASFASGLYLIQFTSDRATKTYRIIVAN